MEWNPLGFYYLDDEFKDVILPHDPDMMESDEFDEVCERLSGDVTTYFMEV